MASKNEITFKIMQDNADRSMNEVLSLLADALGRPGDIKFARGYYTFGLRNGMPGEKPERVGRPPKTDKLVEAAKREGKEYAAKAAKAPKVTKVPKPKVEKDKTPITDKTVEELNDIKAKNLERLRRVGQKFYKNAANGKKGLPEGFDPAEAKAEVDAMLTDDTFKMPAFLTKDQVKVLV